MASLVIQNAKSDTAKEAPYMATIACYFAMNESDELIEYCLHRLAQLGVKLPRHANSVQVKVEHAKLFKTLKRKSDQDLLSLPICSDSSVMLPLRIMSKLVFTLHQTGRTALLGLVAWYWRLLVLYVFV
jgi:hypothetical protein